MVVVTSFLDGTWISSSEKYRGALTSVASSGISSATLALLIMTGSPPVASAVIGTLFGNVLSYSFDIVFAKRAFKLPKTSGEVDVPYSDLWRRMTLLGSSFLSRMFHRFVILTIIETITIFAMTRLFIRLLDDHAILVKTDRQRRWRDTAITLLSALAVFITFGNVMRFDWAYNMNIRTSDRHLDILITSVVLAWMAISVLVICASSMPPPNPKPQGSGSHHMPLPP